MAIPGVLPGFGVRLTDVAIYNATKPFWLDPGLEVIIGKSPLEIVAMTGARLIHNQNLDGHATIYDNWMDVPCTIVVDNLPGSPAFPGSPSSPPQQPFPLNVGSGTLPDGRAWAWQCSVEFYTGGVLPPLTPQFQVKADGFTGNGTSQSPSVGFDLTGPRGAVFVKGKSGGASGRGEYRNTGMTGSSPIGASLDADGITALLANGFSVGANARANANAVVFGHLAMADPSGTYMRAGTYIGLSNVAFQIQDGNPGSVTFSCFTADARWVGAIADFTTQQYLVVAVVPNVSVTFDVPWAGASGIVGGTVLGDNRLIVADAGGLWTPTHVWVMGQTQVYRSTDFPANESVLLAVNGTSPITTGIKSFGFGVHGAGPTGFVIGTSGEVNSNNAGYYWVALRATGSLLNLFRSGVKNPASGSDTISGLPFQPGWVTTIESGNNKNGIWRCQNVQSGTDSTNWGPAGDAVIDVPANGIRSLTADGFTTGSQAMPAAAKVYWFAFKGAGSISPLPGGPFVGACAIGTGTIGIPYYGQLAASGGTAPYTYALIFGGLPPGLVLNPITGVISGTPTTVGTYAYSIRITDSTLDPALTSSVSCAIVIGTVGPTPTPPQPTPVPTSGCSAPIQPASVVSTGGCTVPTHFGN